MTNSWSPHLLGRSQAAEYSLHHSVPESPSSKGPRDGQHRVPTMAILNYGESPKLAFAMLQDVFALYGEEQNCLHDRASLCSGRDHFVRPVKLWRCFCKCGK